MISHTPTRRQWLKLTGVWISLLSLGGCQSEQRQIATSTISTPAGEAPSYIVDLDRLPGGYGSAVGQEQSLLLTSMQGILNRRRPTLWLRSNPGQSPGMDLWERIVDKVRTASALDYAACIQRLAQRETFQGLVVVDRERPSSYDLATTLAGLHDLIIVTDRTLSDVTGTNLPIRFDLRNQFKDDGAVIARLSELKAAGDRTMMMRQTPWGHPEHYHAPERTRDFAILRRQLVVPVTANYPLADFYAEEWPAHILYGQTPHELDDVSAASSHGKVWLGVNTNTYNLSYLAGLAGDPGFVYRNPAPDTPAVEKKIYLCFIFSDGDNIKMNVETMARNWQDRARGRVPLGWTIAPLMAGIAPTVLHHYYATQTRHDCFIAGVSGFAYYYTNMINLLAYPDFWALTQKTLQQLNLTVVWTFGQLGIDRTRRAFLEEFARHYPAVTGWLDGFGDPSGRHGLQRYRDGAIHMIGSRPSIAFQAWLPDSSMKVAPEQALTVARQDLEHYVSLHPERPLFIPVGVPIYPPHNWSPSKIVELVSSINIDAFEVVRPDVMLKMIALTTR